MPVLIDYERKAREFLVKERHQNLHDQVSRAYGILRTAQTISSSETMQLLSRVRMGVNLGLIEELKIPKSMNSLFKLNRHICKRFMESNWIPRIDNIERAKFLRAHLNKNNTQN